MKEQVSEKKLVWLKKNNKKNSVIYKKIKKIMEETNGEVFGCNMAKKA